VTAPRLVWSGLTVRVGRFTLGPLSGELDPGIWRLAGANGAGKTTLFRLFAGALAPDAGEVRLPHGRPDVDVAARVDVGWIPAVGELPDLLTAGEAWRMMAGLRRARTGDGDARLLALGLDPDLRLGACSLGQRKKAELVAGFAGEPPILLLDEAFAPLDADARATLASWLEGWRATRVIVLAEHGALPVRVDGELWLGAAEG
jgi:ABC-type multidrug transport system ATPase subunit